MNSLGLTRKAQTQGNQSGKIGKREVGGYHNEYQWLLISLSEASPLNKDKDVQSQVVGCYGGLKGNYKKWGRQIAEYLRA